MEKIKINPKTDLKFDLKVVEQCKSCKRYGSVATCPPYIEKLDYYQKLLPTYKHGFLYYERFEIDNYENWRELGKMSSEKLRKFVIKERDKLIDEGHYFVVAFGGGSCKNCDKCSIPCRFPDKALIPMEGTGMNIVEMMKKFGVEIKHPVKDFFYRVGCIFYD